MLTTIYMESNEIVDFVLHFKIKFVDDLFVLLNKEYICSNCSHQVFKGSCIWLYMCVQGPECNLFIEHCKGHQCHILYEATLWYLLSFISLWVPLLMTMAFA